jgi:hypothetical protein
VVVICRIVVSTPVRVNRVPTLVRKNALDRAPTLCQLADIPVSTGMDALSLLE